MFREIEKNIETQTKSKQSTWTKTLKYKHWSFRGTQNRARWVFGGRERNRGHLGRGRSWWTDWCWRRWEMRVSMVLGLCLDGFFSQPCPTREIMRWTTPLGAKNEGKSSVKLLLKPERSQKKREFQRSEIWSDYTLHRVPQVEGNNPRARLATSEFFYWTRYILNKLKVKTQMPVFENWKQKPVLTSASGWFLLNSSTKMAIKFQLARVNCCRWNLLGPKIYIITKIID